MTNKKLRLTVAVSCYQKTPYMRPMLDSILAVIGNRGDTEFLVCDDGSPAGGDGDTAREYAARHPMMRVLRNGVNRGIRYSYMRFVEEARGKYFLPFDCDDILLPFDLDGAMAFLDAHREFAATYGKKRYFDDVRGDLVCEGGGDHSRFALTILPRTTHNAMLIRLSDLREAGGYASPLFKTEIAGPVDLSMWIALSVRKDLLFVDEYRLLYRYHRKQYTTEHPEEYAKEFVIIRRELAANFPELAEAIRTRSYYFVPAEQLRAAGILFGAEFASAELPGDERLVLLDQAEKLFPDDMGIWESRVRLLLRMKRWKDAMEAAQTMFVKSRGKPYSELGAASAMIEAAEKLGIPSMIFQELKRRVEHGFFAMREDHRKILARFGGKKDGAS